MFYCSQIYLNAELFYFRPLSAIRWIDGDCNFVRRGNCGASIGLMFAGRQREHGYCRD